jgi:hypothetical protein
MMTSSLLFVATIAVTISAVFAIFAYNRMNRLEIRSASQQLSELMRDQVDRILQFSDKQTRGLREELGGAIRGFQDSTLKALHELANSLATRINKFGGRLDLGVRIVGDRAAALGARLDSDIARMGEDAGQARDSLIPMMALFLRN